MKGTLAIAAATCFFTRSLDAAEIIDRIILPNWAAAREDMSRQPSIQPALSGPTLEVIKNSPVPVILPPAMTTALGSAETPKSRFAALEDGYTATLHGAQYDIVVNATNQVLDNGQAVPEQIAPILSTEDGGGVSVSFRKYATSYRVEFFCLAPLLDGQLCVKPEDALEIASSMMIVGGKGL